MIETLFEKTARRLGLGTEWGGETEPTPFRRPARGPQLRLFDE
jgi:hypothetical protein